MAVMLGPVERSGRQPDDRPSVQFQPPILCNFTPPLTASHRMRMSCLARTVGNVREWETREQPSQCLPRRMVRRAPWAIVAAHVGRVRRERCWEG
jgi:hypothetical protein